MSRAILVVPERIAGWRPEGVQPFLDGVESATHAALCAAGVTVEVKGAGALLAGADLEGEDLIVMVRPSEGTFRAVESAMRSGGTRLLRIMDWPGGGNFRGPRARRSLCLRSPTLSMNLSRLPRRSRVAGWRGRVSFPPLAVLCPAEGEEVVATWGRGGGPALLRDSRHDRTLWTAGFPLDHLEAQDLSRLMEVFTGGRQGRESFRPPVPDGARAVVILLHDVEEALPDDPRGLRSVREGTEACLDSQTRHGIRATYNLVGTFAEQIPDLVRRMAAEGHELASHGATHRVVAGLDPSSLRAEVEGAEDRIGGISGKPIRGFRSPRSRWSGELLDLLADRGYLWNAEADDSPFPYPVPRESGRSVVRVPVTVDDWDYVRKGASPGEVLRLWKGEVLSAEKRGCWVAIGSHPSVLGAHPARMGAFHEFVRWLSSREVRLMTVGEASAWWMDRLSTGEGHRAEVSS